MFLGMKKLMAHFMQNKIGKQQSIKKKREAQGLMGSLKHYLQLFNHSESSKKQVMPDSTGKIPMMFGKKSMKRLKS